jgi:hypothetical protein
MFKASFAGPHLAHTVVRAGPRVRLREVQHKGGALIARRVVDSQLGAECARAGPLGGGTDG